MDRGGTQTRPTAAAAPRWQDAMMEDLHRRAAAYQSPPVDATAKVYATARPADPMSSTQSQPQGKPGSPTSSSCSSNFPANGHHHHASSPAPASRVVQHAPTAASQHRSVQHSVTSPATAAALSIWQQGVFLSDFVIGKVIGAGSYGRVSIAQHRSSGQWVAIKALSKAACIRDGQVRHVLDEKALLSYISHSGPHPNLVNLKACFQDAQCLYLVMEFVAGGDFFTFLRDYPKRVRSQDKPKAAELQTRAMHQTPRVREDHARFYAAQIILALEHLHSRGIIFRDLKPENMLLTELGYVKVTDFGFAKRVDGPTYTMCGTPDYLAPEVILNHGHGAAVDWWSLGCIVYEMMYGLPPFYGNGHPTETYKNVLSRHVIFPEPSARSAGWSSHVLDFINGLLQLDPRNRYGVAGGIATVKSHPWFSGLVWDHVLNQRYQPPYRPDLSGPHDTSNFDDDPALASRPMVHPFPLTADQQRLFASWA